MKQIVYKKILIIILYSMKLVALDTMISINNFGAIPNDNKDDSEAIKKALEVNGYITMTKGIYNVHGLIRINKKTVIDGNGSRFVSKLDTSNNGRTSKNILTLKGDKVVIKDLILDGAYTNGNSIRSRNVSSLLHIYDSKNIVLENVDTVNYASNWWKNDDLDSNHQKDMYHVIYIGFSKSIEIKNMEQRANIQTEGLLIYESDDIKIDNFKSLNSPKIWTSLHVVASDNIELNDIEVADGVQNQGGSSINFIADNNFTVKNTITTTKQGFDISNEVRIKGSKGRIGRDTSNGIFENCHFEGQRALHGYPSIVKNENLVFKNTKFIPTKEGYETWGARIQRGGEIRFEDCTFGNKKFKTYGLIMGDSDVIDVVNCKFINPLVGIYIFGKKIGKINVEHNDFEGNNYSPVNFYWKFNLGQGKVREFYNLENRTKGQLIDNNFFNIKGQIQIENTLSK